MSFMQDIVCSITLKWYSLLIWIFILKVLTIGDIVECLRLLEVRVPNHTVRNKSARLDCNYDLDGEALYSVKWYKDGNEFYRYVPMEVPPVSTFNLPGVNVDLENSTETSIVLSPVTLQSSGRYRCEVSAEAPSFQTVTDHGDMTVVALPEEGPRITGGRPRYQIGDTVSVNCTSGRSKPAAQLSWFINGEPADPNFQKGPYTIITGREGLETSILTLEFPVRQKHFKRGDMKLKCLATIATLYWKTNEESVEGDRPLRPPVREIVQAPANSRADRVQAASGAAPGGCNLITYTTFPSCTTLVVIYGIITLLHAHIINVMTSSMLAIVTVAVHHRGSKTTTPRTSTSTTTMLRTQREITTNQHHRRTTTTTTPNALVRIHPSVMLISTVTGTSTLSLTSLASLTSVSTISSSTILPHPVLSTQSEGNSNSNATSLVNRIVKCR